MIGMDVNNNKLSGNGKALVQMNTATTTETAVQDAAAAVQAAIDAKVAEISTAAEPKKQRTLFEIDPNAIYEPTTTVDETDKFVRHLDPAVKVEGLAMGCTIGYEIIDGYNLTNLRVDGTFFDETLVGETENTNYDELMAPIREHAKHQQFMVEKRDERFDNEETSNLTVGDVNDIRDKVEELLTDPRAMFETDALLLACVTKVIKSIEYEVIIVGKGASGTVYRFNGRYFEELTGKTYIYNLVSYTCQSISKRGLQLAETEMPNSSDAERKAVKGFWKGVSTLNKMTALTTAITARLTVTKESAGFDEKFGQLVPFLNGTYNLKTHKFVPSHTSSDRFTHLVPMDYDPVATAPCFLKALNNCFENNQPNIDWMQAYCGSALLGKRREEMIAFVNGCGGTGKSTLFVGMAQVLGIASGGYGYVANTKGMDNKRTGNATQPEIANGFGKMLYVVDDMDKNSSIDEGMMKNMANMLWMNVRSLYENGGASRWTASVLFLCNRVPTMDTEDSGTERRIMIVPANGKVTPELIDMFKDTGFDDKMPFYLSTVEAAGIMNWLLAGLKKYQDARNTMPAETESMIAEKAAYKDRTNAVFGFMKSGLFTQIKADMVKDTDITKPIDVFEVYKFWCSQEGYDFKMKKGTLMDALSKHGIVPASHHVNDGSEKGTTVYGIKGWKLMPQSLVDTIYNSTFGYPDIR